MLRSPWNGTAEKICFKFPVIRSLKSGAERKNAFLLNLICVNLRQP